MKLDVVRDGKYLALRVEGSIEPFVIRDGFERYPHSKIYGLATWLDSQNQKPWVVPEPRSPAFETVEDTQRRGQMIDSLFESWYEENYTKTPAGAATARAAYAAGLRQGQLRPKGQENASISKIPDSPTTRHAYSHGEATPKSKPHADFVTNWFEYPKDTFATPDEWCAFFGVRISNKSGWQGPNGQSYALLVNVREFVHRAMKSLICHPLPSGFQAAYMAYEKT